jgi:hypothetical protein
MPAVKPPFPRLNRSHPLAQGLVLDVPFAEGSGTNLSDTINNLAGVLTPTNASWESHNHGYDIAFTSGVGRVTYTTPPYMNDLAKVSFEILFLRTGTGGGNFGRLFEKGSTNFPFAAFFDNTAGKVGFQAAYTGGNNEWTWAAVATSVWYHIIITFDSSSVANNPTFYLDGVNVAATQTAADTTGTLKADNGNIVLGNRNAGDRGWAGKIALFREWNRILSADEVAQLQADPYQIYKRKKVI